MRFIYVLFIFFSSLISGLMAYNCSCANITCPPRPVNCIGSYTLDPCGCCTQCSKKEWEPCGGESWVLGYCAANLKCANITGQTLVELPHVGVCKSMRKHSTGTHYFEDDDELCPEYEACFKVMGTCDCVKKRTCFMNFMTEARCRMQVESDQDHEEVLYRRYNIQCYTSGCNITNDKCVCGPVPCGQNYEFNDQMQCNTALGNFSRTK
ncbi:cysteine-rich motor neuron 1 -like [Pelobates cultripes]|uniref:Cysteine-rich motor neuron 1 -like n=1 Tax=Pelobates cultripes TaxID=61616 RepID=A0AAD1T6V7_PELCU|nr:cysteine-rich motor neuron 1 -like [Pelobates cultripes]